MKAPDFTEMGIAFRKLSAAMNKFQCSVYEASQNIKSLSKTNIYKKEHPFKKFMS